MRRCAWVLMLLAVGGSASAAKLESLKLTSNGNLYHLDVRVRLEVAASEAYRAFADPANLIAIDPEVEQAQVLGRVDTRAARLYSAVRVCVGPICKTLRQIQDMNYYPHAEGGALHAELLGGYGDFRSGRADWQFRPAGAATELHFAADLEPDFWVPPLVGPWMMETALHDQAERTSAGIERVARALPKPATVTAAR